MKALRPSRLVRMNTGERERERDRERERERDRDRDRKKGIKLSITTCT